MQTTLESTGQLERRLNMAVPLAEIETEVAKRLARLAKNVKVPGFRPGKVPLKLVAQQYGPQVRSDVISESVQSSLADAIKTQNLRVAGYPRIEPRTDGASAEQLEFAAVFEVYPDVTLQDLGPEVIERPVAEVTPADVEETLAVLRKQRTRYNDVQRPTAAGDRVTVDFSGRIDGVEFPGGQAKDFAIVVGEGRMLPEFEAAVTGMSAGEQKSFSLTFPADYHGKEVAGKTAEFSLTVHRVAEPQLPELDEAFVKSFGVASGALDDLRAEVAANLRLELKRKIESRIKDQAMAALRKQATFPVPKALVEQEAHNMTQQMAANLRQQGMKPEDIKLAPEMFTQSAQDRVALGLVLAELVRAHGLQPKPEEVKALVQEAAQTYEHPEAVVRWHYEKPERLNEFEHMAVERNVVNWVLSRVRVEDKPTSFHDLMNPGR